MLLIWCVWVYEIQKYSDRTHILYKFISSAFNNINHNIKYIYYLTNRDG